MTYEGERLLKKNLEILRERPNYKSHRQNRFFGNVIVKKAGQLTLLMSLMLIGSYVLSNYWGGSKSILDSQQASSKQSVESTAIIHSNNQNFVEKPRVEIISSGYIVPLVKSQIYGDQIGRITNIYVKVGDYVKAGDILARLDDSNELEKRNLLVIESELIASEIDEIRERLSEAIKNLNRHEKLRGEGFGTQKLLNEAIFHKSLVEVEYKKVIKKMALHEELIKQSSYAIDRRNIRAPFSGQVIDVNAHIGKFISLSKVPGGELCTLIDRSQLFAEVEIDEAKVQNAINATEIDIYVPAISKVFKGKLGRPIFEVNKVTGNVKMQVNLLNHNDEILSNMAAQVTFSEGYE